MLEDKHCTPCDERNGALNALQIKNLLSKVSGWELSADGREITKDFSFLNFAEALLFINKIGAIAEDEGHHPNIFLHNWNKVQISLSTHSVKGLTENDFILATKIDSSNH